ncbi:hypothetical protein HZH68_004711 [Vespula germanica]|uniref:Uncharacterized protein n=1 Tax=Vespula germanica TaxID=30212 RepID=A0A834NIJ4_VESGE|nr:hypothetical protein HZH68_004711 [Vespula germanica]
MTSRYSTLFYGYFIGTLINVEYLREWGCLNYRRFKVYSGATEKATTSKRMKRESEEEEYSVVVGDGRLRRVQTRLKPAGVLHLGDDPAKSAKRLKEEQFCGGKGVPEMRMISSSERVTKGSITKDCIDSISSMFVQQETKSKDLEGEKKRSKRPSENGRPFLLPPSRTTVDLMRGPSGSSARCTLPSIVVRNDGMLAMARSPTDL